VSDQAIPHGAERVEVWYPAAMDPDLALTTMTVEPPAAARAGHGKVAIALVILWSAAEPERVGEAAVLSSTRPHVLGRGLADLSASALPLLFAPRREEAHGPGMPVKGKGISRRQLEVVRQGGKLSCTRVGRCPMVVDGRTVDQATLEPGDRLLLQEQLLLGCYAWAPSPAVTGLDPRFGDPDVFGLVGESPVAWSLRKQLAFAAQSEQHVLLLGPTGSGKELSAHCIHGLSRRADAPFVARNAATLPDGIIDAELFGNVADYPNPGTPDRDGLIGAAHHGTLFLDEVGELGLDRQAHLLRVLDGGGEYQRLGEAKLRRSDFRLIAATNRSISALKDDFLARFTLRLTLPGLDPRSQDIPLLLRHLTRRAHKESPGLVARLLDERGEPRFSADLVQTLVGQSYRHHVRELNAHLWEAIRHSDGDVIELPPGLAESLAAQQPADVGELSDAAITDRIGEHDGNITRAAQSLGISRHALRRLLAKRGLDPPS
jgi:transcriptional regulator with AAA-type ATPase domain